MLGWLRRRYELEQPHDHELVAPARTEAPADLAAWEVESIEALRLLDELTGHLRNIERGRAGASISTLVNTVLDVRWRVQRSMNMRGPS